MHRNDLALIKLDGRVKLGKEVQLATMSEEAPKVREELTHVTWDRHKRSGRINFQRLYGSNATAVQRIKEVNSRIVLCLIILLYLLLYAQFSPVGVAICNFQIDNAT